MTTAKPKLVRIDADDPRFPQVTPQCRKCLALIHTAWDEPVYKVARRNEYQHKKCPKIAPDRTFNWRTGTSQEQLRLLP